MHERKCLCMHRPMVCIPPAASSSSQRSRRPAPPAPACRASAAGRRPRRSWPSPERRKSRSLATLSKDLGGARDRKDPAIQEVNRESGATWTNQNRSGPAYISKCRPQLCQWCTQAGSRPSSGGELLGQADAMGAICQRPSAPESSSCDQSAH